MKFVIISNPSIEGNTMMEVALPLATINCYTDIALPNTDRMLQDEYRMMIKVK